MAPKPKASSASESDTIIDIEVVSEPGARVVETVFTLSESAQRQLSIHASVPPASTSKSPH